MLENIALYSAILLVFIILLDASASIKQFSTDLVSTRKAVPDKISATTKVYKAGITEGRLPELKTAVLWHAPPYQSLSAKLSPNEQIEIDQVAMQILIDGAAEKNEDIMKAKSIISKKEPISFKIGQLLLSQAEETSSQPHWIWGSKAKEEASSTINQISNYLYSSYQELKPFYQMTTHRDMKVIERYQQAQNKLELISGIESVARVQALFNKERI